MNYEETEHRNRASQAAQQGSKTAQEIRIESGHRTLGEGIRDVAATGVSLCARGRKAVKSITNSRGKRSGDCKITSEYNQGSSAIKQEDQRKHQWDYNRSDKCLSKTIWRVRKITDRLSLNMNLIG